MAPESSKSTVFSALMLLSNVSVTVALSEHRQSETLPRYMGKLEIQNGKIRISNQKQAIEFLKMLNDSILKSELTETEYDSAIKTELPPLE